MTVQVPHSAQPIRCHHSSCQIVCGEASADVIQPLHRIQHITAKHNTMLYGISFLLLVGAAAAQYRLDDQVIIFPEVTRPNVMVLPPRQPAVIAPQQQQAVVMPQPPVAMFPRQQFLPAQQNSLFPQLPLATSTIPFCTIINSFLAHGSFGTSDYHFSWCHVLDASFSYDEAQNYCRSLTDDNGSSLGYEAVSIEDFAEDQYISSIISLYNIENVWTSGYKVNYYQWTWQSGSTSGYTNWSPTGGLGIPQPDNREGNENCLAVLNNVYNDGIVWHDIACDYKKQVMCERPVAYNLF